MKIAKGSWTRGHMIVLIVTEGTEHPEEVAGSAGTWRSSPAIQANMFVLFELQATKLILFASPAVIHLENRPLPLR